MVKNCENPACKSPYQDVKYGNGKRVMNIMKKVAGQARCTVCGKEQRSSNAPVEVKKKAG